MALTLAFPGPRAHLSWTTAGEPHFHSRRSRDKMGGVLGCYGELDEDVGDLLLARKWAAPQRAHSGDSFVHKLQRSLSTTWNPAARFQGCHSSGQLTCGEDDDDDDDDPVNWDTFLLKSNHATASSGSRLLSALYSRVLDETEDNACYFDARGRRVFGHYLDRVDIVDDYFSASGRKRARSTSSLPDALELHGFSDHEPEDWMSATLPADMDFRAARDPILSAEERAVDSQQLPSLLFSPMDASRRRMTLGLDKSCSSAYNPQWNYPSPTKAERPELASTSQLYVTTMRAGALTPPMAG